MEPNAVNVVHEQSNWALRIKAEVKASTQWQDEWGFLAGAGGRELSKATASAKYFHTGGPSSCLLKSLRVPGARENQKLPEVLPERYQEVPLRPSTAMESVVMSTTLRRAEIHDTDPNYRPNSRNYGSRLSLEQFGIAQHGVRATRTKLPSN